MKQGDNIVHIQCGKYRYRGHIIYKDGRRRWICCPDPSDMRVCHRTLRDSKKYIDEWENAFEEGRTYGNIICATEETLSELKGIFVSMSRDFAEAFQSATRVRSILDSVKS